MNDERRILKLIFNTEKERQHKCQVAYNSLIEKLGILSIYIKTLFALSRLIMIRNWLKRVGLFVAE